MTNLKDLTYPAKVYTAREVYGYDAITAPKGYRYTGEFRLPVVGDIYLSVDYIVENARAGSYSAPRLILAPLPKRKRWVIEQIEDEPRSLQPGESGMYPRANASISADFYTNRTKVETDAKFCIVSIREEEVG